MSLRVKRLASISVAESAIMLALTVLWGLHVTVSPTVLGLKSHSVIVI
jgi:hypothetical protein